MKRNLIALIALLSIVTSINAQHVGNKLVVESPDSIPFTLIVSGYKVNKTPATKVMQSDIYMDEVRIKVIFADTTYAPVVSEVVLAKRYTDKQMKKSIKAGAKPVLAPTTARYQVIAKKKKSKVVLHSIKSAY